MQNEQKHLVLNSTLSVGSTTAKHNWVIATHGEYNNLYFLGDSNTHFRYHLIIPGLSKEDIDIEIILEKHFITVVVKLDNDIKAEEYTWLNKSDCLTKIVKGIDDVNTDKDLEIELKNGLLLIEIPKKYPTRRKTVTL